MGEASSQAKVPAGAVNCGHNIHGNNCRRRLSQMAWSWPAAFFLSFCAGTLQANALTAVNDSASTLPNAAITLAVLTNDFVSTTNTTAILRVTQPVHGRVVINSIPTNHAELTPLFQFAATQLSNTVRQVAVTNLYPWYLTNGVWLSLPTNTPANPDNNWIGGFFRVRSG